MEHVILNNIWPEVSSLAAKAKRRKAALAYVTEDLLKLRKEDVLVVDASDSAI